MASVNRRENIEMAKSGGRKPEETGLGAYPPYKVEEKPPETAEDFLSIALKKAGPEEVRLDEIVRMLRDRYKGEQIRKSLHKLQHRAPVDPVTQIRRHAVELYAKMHNITPANLMVTLKGDDDRKDPKGSERYKLREARKFVVKEMDYVVGARAVAENWEHIRPKGKTPITHLKKVNPEV